MYLKNMFQFCSDQHSHFTRSITSLSLVPPPIKIQLFKHSFTYQGIWNFLSLNMKIARLLLTTVRINGLTRLFKFDMFKSPILEWLQQNNEVSY